jgi:enolase
MKATPQNIVKIFKKAIEFLKVNSWCQKAFAMTAKGRAIGLREKNAKIFCGSAAIEKSLIEMGLNEAEIKDGLRITSDVFIKENEIDIYVFNDRRDQTKENVIEAFQKIVNKYEKC